MVNLSGINRNLQSPIVNRKDVQKLFKSRVEEFVEEQIVFIINIAGLSVGIACCVLIFLYVQYELSYDKYNVKAGQIYRLTEVLHLPDGNNERAVTSPPMAPTPSG
jgi:putative ABC transport system permease protein